MNHLEYEIMRFSFQRKTSLRVVSERNYPAKRQPKKEVDDELPEQLFAEIDTGFDII